jgi:hypothetical protein
MSPPEPGGQRATQGAPNKRTASTLVRFSACDHFGQPSARSEPQTNRWHHPGDDGARSQQHVWNPCHRGHDDHEGNNLSPKGSS